MNRLRNTYIGSGNPGKGFVGLPRPEDAELAEELRSAFEDTGLELKVSTRPYGGGFAQGWENFFSFTSTADPTDYFGVVPILCELSKMHELDGQPDMEKVYSVAGHFAVAKGLQDSREPQEL